LNKILIPLAIILGLVIVGVLFSNYFSLISHRKSEYPKATVPILKEVNMNKLRVISTNPDLIFEKINWSAEYIYKRNNFTFAVGPEMGEGAISSPSEIWYPWYGSGIYYEGALPKNSDRKGIIVIHPQNRTAPRPRYWAQNISLPAGNLVLVASIGDVADYIDGCASACSDAIIKIKIFDHTRSSEDTIYEDVVDWRWKDVFLNISEYQNKTITFKIEGHAGGPCAEWCGEWAAIDKFYIARII